MPACTLSQLSDNLLVRIGSENFAVSGLGSVQDNYFNGKIFKISFFGFLPIQGPGQFLVTVTGP